MVDMRQLRMITSIQVPGRTRWTVFDERAQVFYVNIADPAQIVVVASADPARVTHTIAIPVPGPQGLDFDPHGRCLFCACDANRVRR
jgi:hypothetical protein